MRVIVSVKREPASHRRHHENEALIVGGGIRGEEKCACLDIIALGWR